MKIMSTKTQNSIAHFILWLLGIGVIGLLALILGYILYKGLPELSYHFITGRSSDILPGGGVGIQLFNTFYLLVLSLLCSLPISIAAGIYLSEYARDSSMTRILRLSIESLATVPSIVLGLFGMIVFVNFMGMGFSILGGALTLVLLNLPMLIRVTETALKAVPQDYREASLALGATKWQTIYKVVLPNAMNGILTGVTLTSGRIIGETAILIFTAGTTISRYFWDFDLTAGGETLAVHLWYLMSTGLVPDRDAIANGIGALLIFVILIFNLGLTLPLKLWKKNY